MPQDSDGQPSAKRKRVTQACEICRRRKVKCDGMKPCTTCRTAGQTCQFSEDAEASTSSMGLLSPGHSTGSSTNKTPKEQINKAAAVNDDLRKFNQKVDALSIRALAVPARGSPNEADDATFKNLLFTRDEVLFQFSNGQLYCTPGATIKVLTFRLRSLCQTLLGDSSYERLYMLGLTTFVEVERQQTSRLLMPLRHPLQEHLEQLEHILGDTARVRRLQDTFFTTFAIFWPVILRSDVEDIEVACLGKITAMNIRQLSVEQRCVYVMILAFALHIEEDVLPNRHGSLGHELFRIVETWTTELLAEGRGMRMLQAALLILAYLQRSNMIQPCHLLQGMFMRHLQSNAMHRAMPESNEDDVQMAQRRFIFWTCLHIDEGLIWQNGLCSVLPPSQYDQAAPTERDARLLISRIHPTANSSYADIFPIMDRLRRISVEVHQTLYAPGSRMDGNEQDQRWAIASLNRQAKECLKSFASSPGMLGCSTLSDNVQSPPDTSSRNIGPGMLWLAVQMKYNHLIMVINRAVLQSDAPEQLFTWSNLREPWQRDALQIALQHARRIIHISPLMNGGSNATILQTISGCDFHSVDSAFALIWANALLDPTGFGSTSDLAMLRETTTRFSFTGSMSSSDTLEGIFVFSFACLDIVDLGILAAQRQSHH